MDLNGTGRGRVQSTDEVKECGFARPRSSHNGDELSLLDAESDSLEGAYFDGSLSVCLVQIVRL